MQYYKELDVKLVHLNHCANHHIFRNMNLEKEYDFMLVGSIWTRYPLRIRMAKILEKLSSQFKVTKFQHPGYLLNSAYDNKHLEEFAKAINKTKIAITCCGKYRSRYGKLVEIPMCGTALACDLPDQEQDIFSKFLVNIDNSMSDDEIIEILKNNLFNIEEREKKEKLGLNYAQNFTQELYAKRFI